jgi:shikimate kinase / 3-dehydroquinate synthase
VETAAAVAPTHALERHVALVGFMGAGKSTLGLQVADRLGRDFVDLDREIAQRAGQPVETIFSRRGEAEFRVLETAAALDTLRRRRPAVVALGGGAVTSRQIRQALAEHALTVLLEVEPDVAWERVRRSQRPLARDPERFRALHEERAVLYEEVADARATDADGVVLAAAGVQVEGGALERLGELVPGSGPIALVTEPRVAGIHGAAAQLALAARLASTHELSEGEAAKTVAACERLWEELRLDRAGLVVALGGGCVTDAAGFAAATYLRGIPWSAVPTTLVGQVDAAIGGKTALDLAAGKNLVGAFHWPARVLIDPALLDTLPAAERRNGMAEVVKTGLLAGAEPWTLPDPELVRATAAYKAGVCLRDPLDRGPRAALNLGHTFAHALEAATGYGLAHGDAVALGLTAALRLSERLLGLDPSVREEVERLLAPAAVAADRERAWAALRRDKKAVGGTVRLVLLEAPGRPVTGVAVADAEVREAFGALIAG